MSQTGDRMDRMDRIDRMDRTNRMKLKIHRSSTEYMKYLNQGVGGRG